MSDAAHVACKKCGNHSPRVVALVDRRTGKTVGVRATCECGNTLTILKRRLHP